MDKLRLQINQIDEQIQKLLNERFELSLGIAEYKRQNNLPIYDYIREQSIYQKTREANQGNLFCEQIINVQREIIEQSKVVQQKMIKAKYGLIGENIQYSYSPIVHRIIANLHNDQNYDYQLFDIKAENIELILNSKKGVNVTTPYKQTVAKFIEPTNLTSINTIINQTNLVGYNTDIIGFQKLLETTNINQNNQVAIFGFSATTKSIKQVLEQLNIQFTIFARQQDQSNQVKSYDQFNPSEFDTIINTVPQKYELAMQNEILQKIEQTKTIKNYLDLNYFPGISDFGLQLSKLNIKTTNGLTMLLSQALASYYLFKPEFKDQITLENLEQAFCQSKIIIVGLPSIGKTTYGKKLAKEKKYQFIDLDEQLEKIHQMTISEIIEKYSLSYFRKVELAMFEQLLAENKNLVIATGGGIVESEISKIVKNWTVVYLTTDLDEYLKNYDYTNRILFKNEEQLKEMVKKREPMYQQIANKIIKIKR